ncbi:MAG: glucosaminidase domain-containing protein, partial [Candidatus Omnitrophica bacterium]|nr:glucosaminidase domain-containing protein [Candidatus Omnitrophota bacterium]
MHPLVINDAINVGLQKGIQSSSLLVSSASALAMESKSLFFVSGFVTGIDRAFQGLNHIGALVDHFTGYLPNSEIAQAGGIDKVLPGYDHQAFSLKERGALGWALLFIKPNSQFETARILTERNPDKTIDWQATRANLAAVRKAGSIGKAVEDRTLAQNTVDRLFNEMKTNYLTDAGLNEEQRASILKKESEPIDRNVREGLDFLEQARTRAIDGDAAGMRQAMQEFVFRAINRSVLQQALTARETELANVKAEWTAIRGVNRADRRLDVLEDRQAKLEAEISGIKDSMEHPDKGVFGKACWDLAGKIWQADGNLDLAFENFTLEGTALSNTVKDLVSKKVASLKGKVAELAGDFGVLRVLRLESEHAARTQAPSAFFRVFTDGSIKPDFSTTDAKAKIGGVDMTFSDGSRARADITLDKEDVVALGRQFKMSFDRQAIAAGIRKGIEEAGGLAPESEGVDIALKAADELIRGEGLSKETRWRLENAFVKTHDDKGNALLSQAEQDALTTTVNSILDRVSPYNRIEYGRAPVELTAEGRKTLGELVVSPSLDAYLKAMELGQAAEDALGTRAKIQGDIILLEDTLKRIQRFKDTKQKAQDIANQLRTGVPDAALAGQLRARQVNLGREIGVLREALRGIDETKVQQSLADARNRLANDAIANLTAREKSRYRAQASHTFAEANFYDGLLKGASQRELLNRQNVVLDTGRRLINKETSFTSAVAAIMGDKFQMTASRARNNRFPRPPIGGPNEMISAAVRYLGEVGLWAARELRDGVVASYNFADNLVSLPLARILRERSYLRAARKGMLEMYAQNPLRGVPDIETGIMWRLSKAPKKADKAIERLFTNPNNGMQKVKLGWGRSIYVKTNDIRIDTGLRALSGKTYAKLMYNHDELNRTGQTSVIVDVIFPDGQTKPVKMKLYETDKRVMDFFNGKELLQDWEALPVEAKQGVQIKRLANGTLEMSIGNDGAPSDPFLVKIRDVFNAFQPATQYRGFNAELTFGQARQAITEGLADPRDTAEVIGRVMKVCFEKMKLAREARGEKFENWIASEQAKMIIGMLGDNSIQVKPGGGKTIGSIIEMIARAMVFDNVNQILVVRTGETEKLLKNEGVQSLLKTFGMKTENGSNWRTTSADSLNAALESASTIVVFDFANFGHLRNSDNKELIKRVYNQDNIRLDEIHLPLSDRSSFIIGGSKVSVVESLCKILNVSPAGLGAKLEQAKKWVEENLKPDPANPQRLLKVYENKSREEVFTMQQIAGYRNPESKEIALNPRALEEMRKAGVNEYLVRSYLEAKYSVKGTDYNMFREVGDAHERVIPVEAGVDQADRVISDPAYLAYLSRENGIDLKDVYTTKTLNQATLSEILRFKPGASLIGFTGTAEGVVHLLKMHIGKDVDIFSQPDLDAEVIKANGARQKEIILERARQNRAAGKGLLIFCENPELFKELRAALGSDIEIIDGSTDNDYIADTLCKAENAGKIILSNVRGATGYSYEDGVIFERDGSGEIIIDSATGKGRVIGTVGRDVIVAGAERWTAANLYQAIKRNNRGLSPDAYTGESIIMFDQAGLRQAVRGPQIERELGDALDFKADPTKESRRESMVRAGTEARLGEGASTDDVRALLENAHKLELTRISQALTHQAREAGYSRQLIEPLKEMIGRSTSEAERRYLTRKFDEVIAHKYAADLALSPYDISGADRLEKIMKGVADFSSKIMGEVSQRGEVSSLTRVRATLLERAGRKVKDDYNNLVADPTFSITSASNLIEVVKSVRNFERHILSSDAQVEGSIEKATAKIMDKIGAERERGGQRAMDFTERAETYRDLDSFILSNGTRGAPTALIDRIAGLLPNSAPLMQVLTDLSDEHLSLTDPEQVQIALDFINSQIIKNTANPQIAILSDRDKQELADIVVSFIDPNLDYAGLTRAAGLAQIYRPIFRSQGLADFTTQRARMIFRDAVINPSTNLTHLAQMISYGGWGPISWIRRHSVSKGWALMSTTDRFMFNNAIGWGAYSAGRLISGGYNYSANKMDKSVNNVSRLFGAGPNAHDPVRFVFGSIAYMSSPEVSEQLRSIQLERQMAQAMGRLTPEDDKRFQEQVKVLMPTPLQWQEVVDWKAPGTEGSDLTTIKRARRRASVVDIFQMLKAVDGNDAAAQLEFLRQKMLFNSKFTVAKTLAWAPVVVLVGLPLVGSALGIASLTVLGTAGVGVTLPIFVLVGFIRKYAAKHQESLLNLRLTAPKPDSRRWVLGRRFFWRGNFREFEALNELHKIAAAAKDAKPSSDAEDSEEAAPKATKIFTLEQLTTLADTLAKRHNKDFDKLQPDKQQAKKDEELRRLIIFVTPKLAEELAVMSPEDLRKALEGHTKRVNEALNALGEQEKKKFESLLSVTHVAQAGNALAQMDNAAKGKVNAGNLNDLLKDALAKEVKINVEAPRDNSQAEEVNLGGQVYAVTRGTDEIILTGDSGTITISTNSASTRIVTGTGLPFTFTAIRRNDQMVLEPVQQDDSVRVQTIINILDGFVSGDAIDNRANKKIGEHGMQVIFGDKDSFAQSMKDEARQTRDKILAAMRKGRLLLFGKDEIGFGLAAEKKARLEIRRDELEELLADARANSNTFIFGPDSYNLKVNVIRAECFDRVLGKYDLGNGFALGGEVFVRQGASLDTMQHEFTEALLQQEELKGFFPTEGSAHYLAQWDVQKSQRVREDGGVGWVFSGKTEKTGTSALDSFKSLVTSAETGAGATVAMAGQFASQDAEFDADRADLEADFDFSIRNILEDDTLELQQKIEKINALADITPRDLKLHIARKKELARRLGVASIVACGFSAQGIIDAFVEAKIANIIPSAEKEKARNAFKQFAERALEEMVKPLAEANVQRDGAVDHAKDLQDAAARIQHKPALQEVEDALAGFTPTLTVDIAPIITRVEALIAKIQEAEDPDTVEVGSDPEARSEVVNCILANSVGQVGEHRDGLIALLNIYLRKLQAENEEGAQNEQIAKVNAAIEKLKDTKNGIEDETNIDSASFTYKRGKEDRTEPLARLLRDMNVAFIGSYVRATRPVLMAQKEVLELREKRLAKELQDGIDEKLKGPRAAIDTAKQAADIEGKGSRQPQAFDPNAKDAESKKQLQLLIAEYEAYRRIFRPDLPAITGADDIDNVFAAIDTLFGITVSGEAQEQLAKLVFLMRWGSQGKIKFSKIGDAVWGLTYADLKARYEGKFNTQSALFGDENIDASRAKLAIKKVVETLREYKTKLEELEGKVTREERVEKADLDTLAKRKEFLKQKGLAKLTSRLAKMDSRRVNKLIIFIDGGTRADGTAIQGLVDGVSSEIEAFSASSFGVNRDKIAQEILSLALKGKAWRLLDHPYKMLKRLGKKVFVYDMDTQLIEHLFATERQQSPVMMLDSLGRLHTVFLATYEYWLVMNDSGAVTRIDRPGADHKFNVFFGRKLDRKEYGRPLSIFSMFARNRRIEENITYAAQAGKEDIVKGDGRAQEILRKYGQPAPVADKKEEIKAKRTPEKRLEQIHANADFTRIVSVLGHLSSLADINAQLKTLRDLMRQYNLQDDEILQVLRENINTDTISGIEGVLTEVNGDPVRVELVKGALEAFKVNTYKEPSINEADLEAPRLRSYTGAGETPVHDALGLARERLGAGDRNEGGRILEILLAHLRAAQNTGDTAVLTNNVIQDIFGGNYDVPVDLANSKDVADAIADAENLLQRARGGTYYLRREEKQSGQSQKKQEELAKNLPPSVHNGRKTSVFEEAIEHKAAQDRKGFTTAAKNAVIKRLGLLRRWWSLMPWRHSDNKEIDRGSFKLGVGALVSAGIGELAKVLGLWTVKAWGVHIVGFAVGYVIIPLLVVLGVYLVARSIPWMRISSFTGLISSITQEQFELFQTLRERIRQDRQAKDISAKDPVHEENILDLILMGMDGDSFAAMGVTNRRTIQRLRRVAFIHFLVTQNAARDLEYLNSIKDRIGLGKWDGKTQKTLNKALKRVSFRNALATGIPADFNTETAESKDKIYAPAIDLYRADLERGLREEDTVQREEILAAALVAILGTADATGGFTGGLTETASPAHNPLSALQRVALDRRVSAGLRQNAMSAILLIAGHKPDLALPILEAVVRAPKAKNAQGDEIPDEAIDTRLRSQAQTALGNLDMSIKATTRKERKNEQKEVKARAEKLINTHLNIATDNKLEHTVRALALHQARIVRSHFPKAVTSSSVIRAVSLLGEADPDDNKDDIRAEAAGLIRAWDTKGKLRNVRVSRDARPIPIDPNDQRILNRAEVNALTNRIKGKKNDIDRKFAALARQAKKGKTISVAEIVADPACAELVKTKLDSRDRGERLAALQILPAVIKLEEVREIAEQLARAGVPEARIALLRILVKDPASIDPTRDTGDIDNAIAYLTSTPKTKRDLKLRAETAAALLQLLNVMIPDYAGVIHNTRFDVQGLIDAVISYRENKKLEKALSAALMPLVDFAAENLSGRFKTNIRPQIVSLLSEIPHNKRLNEAKMGEARKRIHLLNLAVRADRELFDDIVLPPINSYANADIRSQMQALAQQLENFDILAFALGETITKEEKLNEAQGRLRTLESATQEQLGTDTVVVALIHMVNPATYSRKLRNGDDTAETVRSIRRTAARLLVRAEAYDNLVTGYIADPDLEVRFWANVAAAKSGNGFSPDAARKAAMTMLEHGSVNKDAKLGALEIFDQIAFDNEISVIVVGDSQSSGFIYDSDRQVVRRAIEVAAGHRDALHRDPGTLLEAFDQARMVMPEAADTISATVNSSLTGLTSTQREVVIQIINEHLGVVAEGDEKGKFSGLEDGKKLAQWAGENYGLIVYDIVGIRGNVIVVEQVTETEKPAQEIWTSAPYTFISRDYLGRLSARIDAATDQNYTGKNLGKRIQALRQKFFVNVARAARADAVLTSAALEDFQVSVAGAEKAGSQTRKAVLAIMNAEVVHRDAVLWFALSVILQQASSSNDGVKFFTELAKLIPNSPQVTNIEEVMKWVPALAGMSENEVFRTVGRIANRWGLGAITRPTATEEPQGGGSIGAASFIDYPNNALRQAQEDLRHGRPEQALERAQSALKSYEGILAGEFSDETKVAAQHNIGIVQAIIAQVTGSSMPESRDQAPIGQPMGVPVQATVTGPEGRTIGGVGANLTTMGGTLPGHGVGPTTTGPTSGMLRKDRAWGQGRQGGSIAGPGGILGAAAVPQPQVVAPANRGEDQGIQVGATVVAEGVSSATEGAPSADTNRQQRAGARSVTSNTNSSTSFGAVLAENGGWASAVQETGTIDPTQVGFTGNPASRPFTGLSPPLQLGAIIVFILAITATLGAFISIAPGNPLLVFPLGVLYFVSTLNLVNNINRNFTQPYTNSTSVAEGLDAAKVVSRGPAAPYTSRRMTPVGSLGQLIKGGAPWLRLITLSLSLIIWLSLSMTIPYLPALAKTATAIPACFWYLTAAAAVFTLVTAALTPGNSSLIPTRIIFAAALRTLASRFTGSTAATTDMQGQSSMGTVPAYDTVAEKNHRREGLLLALIGEWYSTIPDPSVYPQLARRLEEFQDEEWAQKALHHYPTPEECRRLLREGVPEQHSRNTVAGVALVSGTVPVVGAVVLIMLTPFLFGFSGTDFLGGVSFIVAFVGSTLAVVGLVRLIKNYPVRVQKRTQAAAPAQSAQLNRKHRLLSAAIFATAYVILTSVNPHHIILGGAAIFITIALKRRLEAKLGAMTVFGKVTFAMFTAATVAFVVLAGPGLVSSVATMAAAPITYNNATGSLLYSILSSTLPWWQRIVLLSVLIVISLVVFYKLAVTLTNTREIKIRGSSDTAVYRPRKFLLGFLAGAITMGIFCPAGMLRVVIIGSSIFALYAIHLAAKEDWACKAVGIQNSVASVAAMIICSILFSTANAKAALPIGRAEITAANPPAISSPVEDDRALESLVALREETVVPAETVDANSVIAAATVNVQEQDLVVAPQVEAAVETVSAQAQPDWKRYETVAQTYLARRKGTPLTGQMLADAAQKEWQNTGIEVPVELALAMGDLETKQGTVGREHHATNPWNVGEYDNKTVRVFATVEEGVGAYYHLMARNYLSARTPEELLADSGFVDVKGRRYASDTGYEVKLRSIIERINRVIANKAGVMDELEFLIGSILAFVFMVGKYRREIVQTLSLIWEYRVFLWNVFIRAISDKTERVTAAADRTVENLLGNRPAYAVVPAGRHTAPTPILGIKYGRVRAGAENTGIGQT